MRRVLERIKIHLRWSYEIFLPVSVFSFTKSRQEAATVSYNVVLESYLRINERSSAEISTPLSAES
jgi:hypothetical protein